MNGEEFDTARTMATGVMFVSLLMKNTVGILKEIGSKTKEPAKILKESVDTETAYEKHLSALCEFCGYWSDGNGMKESFENFIDRYTSITQSLRFSHEILKILSGKTPQLPNIYFDPDKEANQDTDFPSSSRAELAFLRDALGKHLTEIALINPGKLPELNIFQKGSPEFTIFEAFKGRERTIDH